ncbi:MAG: hypothetical protein ABIP97_03035, partial [Chthoniobacterales bacterium]
MKNSRFLCLLTVLTAAFCSANSALAGTPNLVGTWSGAYDLSTPAGMRKSAAVLVITKQTGANFEATRTWKRMDGTLGHHKGKAVSTASDKFLGVIGFDGKSIVLVKSGHGPENQGQLCGKIVGNKLELILIQSGEVAR